MARIATFMLSAALAFGAGANGVQKVDDFTLIDHGGEAHRLSYYADAPAVVLFVQGNGCPIVRNVLPDLKAVRDRFEPRGVRFLMLNANLQDTRQAIAEETQEWGIDFDVLHDEAQLVATSLEVERTAEVFVIEPKTMQIVYRGAVNDRLTYERQKKEASKHYLADALTQTLEGKDVATPHVAARGCLVNLEPEAEVASYTDTIAPMLKDHCAECHRPGGIGPWAMTSHAMVKGFAPMIREVVRTRRMPPWHADPAVGHWQNDGGLAASDAKTLVRWIEAGAPRGKGPDPLETVVAADEDWPLGEPDLVVDIPAFDIPEAGVVDYQFPVVANPLDEDVWVRAITILPGATEVVHHVLVGTGEGATNGESVFDNYLGGYAPGTGSTIMPEGTGVLVKKGEVFQFQLHYTPYGKAVTDRTRLGVYLHDEKPKNFLRHEVVMSPAIRIPAHAAAHEERAYFEFNREAVLYTILPHSHYRGKSSTFSLRYPDGKDELLLSVPNYDFNWQRGYTFAEPRTIPAGSRLIHTTVYDNSANNPGNPDPTKVVGWGLQSWAEMLYGDFVFRWVDETTDSPIHDKARMQLTQQMGFLDHNMDGKLTLAEAGRLGERWAQRFQRSIEMGDRNQDGGLSLEEWLALSKAMARRRAEQAAGAE